MTSAALLTVVFLTAAAPGADAPAGAPQPSVAPPIPTASVTPSEMSVWYGQRAVLVDAISITAMDAGLFMIGRGSGGSTSSVASPLTFGGFGVFALGGPILHLTYEHPGRAAGSLALRLLGGFASLFVLATHAAMTCNADNGTDHPGCDKVSFPLLFAASLPLLLTAAVDDLLIARATPPAPTSDLSHAWIAPTAGPGSLALSFAGAF